MRVRHRCAPPRAGTDVFSGETDDNALADHIAEAVSTNLHVSDDSAGGIVDATRLERTVSSVDANVTEGVRDCSEDDFQASQSPAISGFDPIPLGSTLISAPMVVVRHKVMDTAATAQEATSTQTSASTASLELVEVSQADSVLSDDIGPVNIANVPQAIPMTVNTGPQPDAPVATAAPQVAAVMSAPSTPVRVKAVNDTFATGAKPSPGNHGGFVTGQPSSSTTNAPRPYLASGTPTDSRGYPAFKFDEQAASQYSSAAQSVPVRPNYESRYPSRSSNCDSPPPPLADSLSSSQSVGMPSGPSDPYGYRRLPQEAAPGYGYSRASGPQQQGPQQPYQYRVPPGAPLPYAPPGARLPPQGYRSPQNDPWDILESSAIGQQQGLLHIDSGGGYGGGGGGGYSNYSSTMQGGPSYSGPSSSYGYGGGGPAGGGGYAAPAPPPPPPSYQYGGGGGYGQQQQYYGAPPPGQYSGGSPQQPGGGYRSAPAPQADPGQFYGGGNYSAPPAPRRSAPPPPDYTYKARAPAGNMPEDMSSFAYGNAYNGGSGFGGNGNYGGQTSYGSPLPGNYPASGQQDETSYPGIELLSPGYPEFERHARQGGGGGGGGRPSGGELRYPGIDGGMQQQRAAVPAGITEYTDRQTPPAYGSSYSGSSYSGFTAPSAYEPPPPEAYARQYQQPPQGGYYGAPPPGPPPLDAQYGYRGAPQGYPQRPMGFSSPEDAVPIMARHPRITVSREITQGVCATQAQYSICARPLRAAGHVIRPCNLSQPCAAPVHGRIGQRFVIVAVSVLLSCLEEYSVPSA